MINCKRKKVLMLVAGGTGGHIYPSLSLINKMKNFKFIIITDKRGKVYYESFFQNKPLNFSKVLRFRFRILRFCTQTLGPKAAKPMDLDLRT